MELPENIKDRSPDKASNVLSPLMIPKKVSCKLSEFKFNEDCSTVCMLCDSSFMLPSKQKEFLSHVLEEHKLVIADVDLIPSLKSYVDYWRVRFKSKSLNYFCTTMLCDVGSEGNLSQDEYFLLSDVIPEDKLLREGLQNKRLEWVLVQQAKERQTPIDRDCIFCRTHYSGPRCEYFNHLFEKHNLHLGSSENLVFTDELFDILEDKMQRLQCLFCDGIFKERTILKEHMRKKQHKRVNPDNKMFDRFYIVNYLEIGKTWQQIQDEPDDEPVEDPTDWSDWVDQEESSVECLYCEEENVSFENILTHMLAAHNFDFVGKCSELKLNFYQQVKLVNYIRRQVYILHCPDCNELSIDKTQLLHHMNKDNHFTVPPAKLWDQPEFYFPTFENDSFLYHLDDNSWDDAED